MIAEEIELWTLDEVKELEFCEFPGGYSPSKPRGDYHYDPAAARRAVNCGPMFFKHVKGSLGGKPLMPEPWQAKIYATLFGWKDDADLRRYRTAYVEIPRGNGKSTMCVVIAGILLYIDDEPGADIFSAAGTRDQAREVFGPFKTNILNNPDLDSISRCYQNSVTRLDPETGTPIGVYKAISADADFQHGGSPHGIIFDELHVQPNRDLWDVLETGKIKRRQPLTVAITTAGFDKHSICYEQRREAEKVRDGFRDNKTFLPVIYAADEGDDWTKPETWRKANPNIGVSIKEEDLAKSCDNAQHNPGAENTFKRLHLDIWTEQETRWISMRKWRQGNAPLPDLTGRDCWAGLDLSSKHDISAFVMAFRGTSGEYFIIPRFWIPEANAHLRERRDGVPYLTWAKQGLITLIEGDWIDQARIRADIGELANKYRINEISVDPWNAQETMVNLGQMGFTVHEHRQGFGSFAGPCKTFSELIHGGKIIHGDNPILTWMAGNVTVKHDSAENVKPDKAKSTERIDGIVAAVMAVGRASQSEGGSVYDTRGVVTLGESEPAKPAAEPVATLVGWGDEDDDD